RTLQTLDSDGDLNNGIQISAWAREVASLKTKIRLDDEKTTDDEVKERLPDGDYKRTEQEARDHYEEHEDDESNEHLGYDNSGSGSGTPVAQPANTTGRLLASNCFQCHGTNGVNGAFGNLAGVPQKDLLDKLNDMRLKPAGANLMAPHARGYTNTDLYWITYYFSRLPKP
ncbi:MAG: hypothetical protein RJA36_1109, partial [Pseudomonadota bacterium]